VVVKLIVQLLNVKEVLNFWGVCRDGYVMSDTNILLKNVIYKSLINNFVCFKYE